MDKKKLKFFVITIVLVFIDQMSKMLVLINKKHLPDSFLFGWIKFTYCENRGMAFGLASGHVRALSIVTLIILTVIVIAMYKHYHKIGKVLLAGATLMIAGGFGNFIDRAFRTFVVDFIDVSNIVKFPIFNIADIFVVIGVALIGISCFIDFRGEDVEKNNS